MIQKAITVTSKGTFTLPAKIRKQMGIIKAGDKLLLTFHEQSQTVELTGNPSIEALQERNAAFLKSRGFTPSQLRKMAAQYQNGDGTAAYVLEKYGNHN